MNSKSSLFRRSSGRLSTAGTAIFTVLLASAPLAWADQHATTAAVSRIAGVSLADVDLSTSAGIQEARNRLRAMAQRVCAEGVAGHDLTSQPTFVACVESTVAGALRQISALEQTNLTVRHSVTRAANVSLADLDLSTAEGLILARERVETMARRLCAELARSRELTYEPNCVHDTLAGALAQVEAISRANDSRTARRLAP